MRLSDRLQTVASLVTEGLTVVDIGTDHGYVPIYLVQNGISPGAIAMDIRKGPVQRAKEHILQSGLENKIETRISDGFEKLVVGEAQSAIIAGMGGELMVRILEQGSRQVQALKELILSPHSELFLVRKYLHRINFKIMEEKMLLDEGKYYTVIKAVKGIDVQYNGYEYKYGKILIDTKNEILQSFILKERDKMIEIINHLKQNDTPNTVNRLKELEKEYWQIEQVIERMEIG